MPHLRELMLAVTGREATAFPEKNLPVRNLFTHVIVGGNYGRSVWVKGTYERRPEMITDREYNVSVKRGALKHYYRFLAHRLSVNTTRPKTLSTVVFLNRKMGSARHITNIGELQHSLARRLPHLSVQRVNEPSVRLRDMAELMRSALMLVTPHGAHFGSVPFMFPGSGVVEIMPPYYDSVMYENLCLYSGLAYKRVKYRSRGERDFEGPTRTSPFYSPITPPASEVVSAAAELATSLPHQRLAAETAADMHIPPRTGDSPRGFLLR